MNQKKGARLALKLSLTVVIPIFLITIAGILLSAYKQSDLSEDLVKREISGIARSLRQTYLATEGNEKFVMKGDNLYKGNTMLSGNYKLVDQLKNEQEVEVSLFFGDVREVTTLKDESGKREINTKMSSEVYDTLKKGEEYFATNIDVLGTDYYGYYVPLYQPGTKEVAGSVFCGRTQNQVTQSLRNTIISMAVVMLVIFLAAFIIVLFMVKRIVKSIDGAVSNLGNVAKGALQFEMKPVLLERGDEVGDIARAIQSLIHSLREILTNITSSAKALDGFSNQFAESFANITDSVDSVNTAVEEIASGATSQADETMSANLGNVEEGQRVSFTVDAYPNDQFEGVVRQIRLGDSESTSSASSSTSSSTVVTYEVVITADNPDLKLKPRLTANITIYTLERANILTLPNKALRFIPEPAIMESLGMTVTDPNAEVQPGKRLVWSRQGNTLSPRQITVGTSNNSVTEVTEGLSEGDEVAVDLASAANMPEVGAGAERSPFMPGPPGSNKNKR